MGGDHSAQMHVHLLRPAASVSVELEALLKNSGYRVSLHASGDALVQEAWRGSPETDCILLDITTFEEEGRAVLHALRKRGDTPPVVFIDGLENGAARISRILSGFLKPAQLLAAGALAASGDGEHGGARARRLAALTEREKEVFAFILQGLTSKEIARELGISPRTVETHRVHIHAKLDTKSLQDLVRLAVDGGLISAANGGR